jgi:hypothetical protein
VWSVVFGMNNVYMGENKIERALETAALSERLLLEFCLGESVVGFCFFPLFATI